MAIKTKCLTPGFIYDTEISESKLNISVSFPKPLSLSEEQAELLEALAHNALELVLNGFTERNKK